MTDPVAHPRPARPHRGCLRTSRLALATLAALAAAPAIAQDALTEPAPGLGGAAPTVATPEAPVVGPPPEQAGMGGQTDLSATAIIRELAPIAGRTPAAPSTVDAPLGPVVVDATHSVDLTVFFAYDSAELLPEALPQVDALGEALRSPELLPHAFLIAGHTDAAGAEAYNLDLSYRRALAVADYLVAVHGIAPGRLVPHGWGETRLRLPSDPGSGVNRRVEVSLVLPREGSAQPRVLRGPGSSYVMVPAAYRGPAWLPGLVDPRGRLAPDALDDFHATPTRLGR